LFTILKFRVFQKQNTGVHCLNPYPGNLNIYKKNGIIVINRTDGKEGEKDNNEVGRHKKWDFQLISMLKIPSSKNLNINVQSA